MTDKEFMEQMREIKGAVWAEHEAKRNAILTFDEQLKDIKDLEFVTLCKTYWLDFANLERCEETLKDIDSVLDPEDWTNELMKKKAELIKYADETVMKRLIKSKKNIHDFLRINPEYYEKIGGKKQ